MVRTMQKHRPIRSSKIWTNRHCSCQGRRWSSSRTFISLQSSSHANFLGHQGKMGQHYQNRCRRRTTKCWLSLQPCHKQQMRPMKKKLKQWFSDQTYVQSLIFCVQRIITLPFIKTRRNIFFNLIKSQIKRLSSKSNTAQWNKLNFEFPKYKWRI